VPTLLAAFHPGYVAANLPGGPIVQAVGAKRVGMFGLLGTACCFALFPIAGRAKGRAISLLVVLMSVMGLFQASSKLLHPLAFVGKGVWI